MNQLRKRLGTRRGEGRLVLCVALSPRRRRSSHLALPHAPGPSPV